MRSRRTPDVARAGKTVFIEITIRADRGHATDLRPYFDAAEHAILQLATDHHAFCGVSGRRVIVSPRQLARHLSRHGFYGKKL